jgi:hypothetical protein
MQKGLSQEAMYAFAEVLNTLSSAFSGQENAEYALAGNLEQRVSEPLNKRIFWSP